MKILMLTSFLDCGGAETHIASLAEALASRGHKICIASNGGRVADMLSKKECGIEHIRIPLGSHFPIRLAMAKRKLCKLIKKGGFDVVHAHSRIPAFLAHGITKKYRVPFVTTIHAKFRAGPIFRKLSRWGTLTLAVSEDLKQYLIEEYKIFSDNIFVIPNGINTEKFKLTERREEKKEFRILFISRLDRDCSQGAELLCKISIKLAEQIPDLKIIIAGGGKCHRKIKRLSIAANKKIGRVCIEVLGYVENTAGLFRGCDLFVGVSRAALEAMAGGIPVILCGNEGYLGILDKGIFNKAAEDNFCGRESMCDKPKEDKLFGDIIAVYDMSEYDRHQLGLFLRDAVCRHNRNDETAEAVEGFYRRACVRIPDTRGEIVLCGFYGFGNLGDDCLLYEAIKRCRTNYPDAKISALTAGGKKDEERFGVRCVKRSSPRAVFKEINCADIFVFGGGTLLQEYTSRRSLLYYTSLLRYAESRGVRCELWGNGIGTPMHNRSAKIMAEALSGCGYVGLRDSMSVKTAIDVCIENGMKLPRIVYEKDLALSHGGKTMQRSSFLMKKYIKATGEKKGFLVVAINGSSGEGFIDSLSKELSARRAGGEGILFIPMFPREDEKVCKKLAKKLGGCVAENLSGRDLISIMEKSNQVIGMRLHSLIFAFLAGVSFVGVGEDSKIESFCRDNGGVYYTDLIR